MERLIGIVLITGLLASGCRPVGLPAPLVPETRATTTTTATSPPTTPVLNEASGTTSIEALDIDVDLADLDELLTELDDVVSEVDDAFKQGEEK